MEVSDTVNSTVSKSRNLKDLFLQQDMRRNHALTINASPKNSMVDIKHNLKDLIDKTNVTTPNTGRLT